MADKETIPEQEKPEQENSLESEAAADGKQNPELLEESGGDATVTGELDLRAKLEQAVEQLAQHKDLALRSQADLQNVRRRAERDVEHAHKFGQEKLVLELLPVVDNLERALDASGEDNDFVKALREGVELTLDMFVKALARFSVETVDPEGEPFDPALHQAVSIVEQDQMEPNTVVSVMQKGYTLHGRIVRPAMVIVSKAADKNVPKDTPKIDEQA